MTKYSPIYEAATLICENHKQPALNYAVNYAAELAHMILMDEPIKDIRVQCLYVLNNIQHWRGPDAKKARDALKAFCKEHEPKR